MRRSVGRMVATAVAIVATLGVAACGNSAGGGSSDVDPEKASAAQADAEDALKAMLDPSTLEWPQPTEPYRAGTGKMAVITCAMQAGCAVEGKAAADAAKALGWDSKVYDGKFDPSVQANLVQQAIAEGVDALVLTAVDVNSIKSAVDAALAADIPVACAMCISGSMRGDVLDSSPDPASEGRLIGTYIGANADPEGADVVGFTDKAFPIVVQRVAGVKSALEDTCPACSWDDVAYPTSDASKPGPPTWTGFLSSHPAGTVQWVVAGYEAMAVPFSRTLRDQGRDDITLTAFDNVLSDGQADIESGETPYQVTVASPLAYSGWAAADNAIRASVGADTWDATALPSALITQDNFSAFDDPSDTSSLFEGYQKLFADLAKG